MNSDRITLKVLMTPSFKEQADRFGIPLTDVLRLLGTRSEPTWVIGDPEMLQYREEDEGRTARIPGRFKFYAIRDDHEAGCDCGCEGMSVVTFLLPSEY